MSIKLVVLSLALLACPSSTLGQWVEVTLDTSFAPYLDVEFVTEETGFVVGMYGTALKTTDGGQTWSHMTVEDCDQCITHFEKIIFYGNRGYIYGRKLAKYNEHLAYRTTDRGATWSKVGGVTWDWVDRLPTTVSEPLEIRYPAERMLLVYNNTRVAVSTDLGNTWTEITSPIQVPGATGVGIGEIAFENATTGLVWKGGRSEPPLASTTDGGASWHQLQEYLYSLNVLGDRSYVGTSVAYSNTYPYAYRLTKRSTDLGISWDTVALVGIESVECLGNICYGHAASSVYGSPDSMAGRIVKSTDRGITWSWQTLTDSAYHLTGLSIPSTRTAYVLIDSSRLFKTLNGGGPSNELTLGIAVADDRRTSLRARLDDGLLLLEFESTPHEQEAIVFDACGRVISRFRLTSDLQQRLNLPDLPSGHYSLLVGQEAIRFAILD